MLLYSDAYLVVADKPSGLLVHRGWANDSDVLMLRVRDALGGEHVHPVHRLDRGTSGTVVLARTREAAASLSRAFEEGRVEKRYLALVRGKPKDDAGVVDHSIPRSEGGPRVHAITEYRVLGRSDIDRCSLVEACPRTGRLHQVRLHLRHIDHPIVGDVRHGNGPINRHYRAAYGLHRLALHASLVRFAHPATGEEISVAAPIPPDLAGPLAALGLPC